MNLINEKIQAYAEAHTSPEPKALAELGRHTRRHIPVSQMLSGHLQGRLLAMFSRLLRPKHVLDIGTYTGYSAICLAEGLQPGGLVHTIDIDAALKPLAERYFRKAGVKSKIRMYTGPALKIIPKIRQKFDLVFIDADKANYSNYYDLVIGRVRPGGLIIADNVLWSGKVLNRKQDNQTRALAVYSKMVKADKRVSQILLPVRDGLLIAQKIV